MVHSRRVTVARARPRASRSRAKLSMSPRRTANRLRERARHQVVNWRRFWRVCLAGQAAVAGQEPGKRKTLGIGEGGLDHHEGSGWGGSGHRAPPGRAETRRAGPAASPSN